jgi:hypothetical protein
MRKHALPILALLMLTVPAILALLPDGTVSGFDIQYHTIAMAQFDQAIIRGEWLPRWAPDMAAGYGYPNFIFYPPLTYYVGLISTASGNMYANALDFVIGVALVGSSVSMYALATYLWGRLSGMVAAVAYVYAPYHLVVAYVKGAVPELLALALWPACILFLIRSARTPGLINPTLFGVFMALTLATNSLSSLLLAGMCLLYVTVHFIATRDRTFPPRALAGFVFGLALSAYYWLPAIAETGNVQIWQMTAGYFRYADHFATLGQLIYSPWGYAPSSFPHEFSLMLGGLQLLAVVCAAAMLRKRSSVEHWFLVVLVVVCCAMTLPISTVVWALLKPIQILQFPWKFLAPAMLGASLLVGWVVSKATCRHAMWLAPILIITAIGLDASHAKPWQTIWRELGFGQPEHIRPWTFDVIGGDITHLYTSYLPKAAKIPAAPRSVAAQGEGFTINGNDKDFTARSPHGGALTLQTFYYPGWQVFVDCRPVPVTISPYGLMQIQVPAGSHAIEARFGATPLRRAAAATSITALLALAMLLGSLVILAIVRKRGTDRPSVRSAARQSPSVGDKLHKICTAKNQ